jgi:hypothetical protein
MMKNIFTIFLVILTGTVFNTNAKAQELNVIAGSGTYTETSGGSVAWTLGEVVTATLVYPNHAVTQGFHQSDLIVVGIETYNELDISVYPNPTRDFINITSSENARMTIYDIQGKLIDNMDVTSTTSQIDVSYLSRGTYTLVFEANGALAKKMKIVIL